MSIKPSIRAAIALLWIVTTLLTTACNPAPTLSSSPLPGPTMTILAPVPIASTTPTPHPALPTAPPIEPTETPGPVRHFSYRVVATLPHDRQAFTQGLIFEEGFFFEGTGLLGQSTLRRVDPGTGTVLQSRDLPPDLFGEGITSLNGKLYQLTWQSNIGFVYDRETFELLQTFQYPSEGWGLTNDGQQLIMSDGTATLRFLDPATLVETGQVEVMANGVPVTLLNELEYIDGWVYANVWQTDLIALIDPTSGRVGGWIDLTGLLGPEDRTAPVDVLNGIAYDTEGDRLFVTGKWWPRIFQIELVPKAP